MARDRRKEILCHGLRNFHKILKEAKGAALNSIPRRILPRLITRKALYKRCLIWWQMPCEQQESLNLASDFNQRWSRGHNARGQGQGHKKNPRPRPRTAFPRTEPLEAKDRNARGQGQGPRTQVQAFPPKKRSSKFFFRRSPIHWRTQNF